MKKRFKQQFLFKTSNQEWKESNKVERVIVVYISLLSLFQHHYNYFWIISFNSGIIKYWFEIRKLKRIVLNRNRINNLITIVLCHRKSEVGHHLVKIIIPKRFLFCIWSTTVTHRKQILFRNWGTYLLKM